MIMLAFLTAELLQVKISIPYEFVQSKGISSERFKDNKLCENFEDATTR